MKEVISYQCEFTGDLFPSKEACAHSGLTYLLGDDHAAHEVLANSAAVIALLQAIGGAAPAPRPEPAPVPAPVPAPPAAEPPAPETLSEYVAETLAEAAAEAIQPNLQPPVCGATTAIADLHPHLSGKTIGALTRAGFKTLGDLVTKSPEMLLAGVDRFGKGALAEVQAVMEAAGLSLATEAMTAPEPTVREDGTLSDEQPAERPTMPVTAETVGQLRQASLEELTQKIHANGSNGHTGQASLREFLRNAEHHLGRAKVVQLMQQHGVTKIADIGASEPDLRAAIEAEMS